MYTIILSTAPAQVTRMTQTQTPTADLILDLARALAGEIQPGTDFGYLDLDHEIDRDAGIDSLARMELLQRLEQRIGRRIDERCLLEATTLRDLLNCTGYTPETGHAKVRTDSVEDNIFMGQPHAATTLVEVLQWHRKHHPDRIQLYWYADPEGEAQTVSYRQLHEQASRVAATLRQNALESQQTVAIMLPSGPEFFFAFMGIILAGGVAVPIYPPTRASQALEHLERQSHILASAETRFLITFTEASRAGRFLENRLTKMERVFDITELLASEPSDHVNVSADDLAFLQYTSGSTGDPKGVMLSHANLLNNIRVMGQAAQATERDVFVSWLPLYHDMGLIGAWMGGLYHGFPLVLMSPMSFIARPARWLQMISRHRGTLSAAPNFAYQMCLDKVRDRDLKGVDLSSLRFCCNGAEPVLCQTVQGFIERFSAWGLAPGAVAPVYGLAENCVGLTFPPPGRVPPCDRIDGRAFQQQRRALPAADDTEEVLHIAACGHALPEHEVRIVGETGGELPDRQIGRIQFRGPSATRGYYRNPEATRELIRNGWHDTGDYGYLVDGELYITGREKDLIIRAGRNIYPYDIEILVGQLPGARPGGVAVFGSRKDGGEERLVVLAETRLRDESEREALRQRIREVCMQAVQTPPDDIVLAPLRTVLKTSSGKIRRPACRELYEKGLIGKTTPRWQLLLRQGLLSLRTGLGKRLRQARRLLYAGWAWLVFGLLTLIAWPLVVFMPGMKLRRLLLKGLIRTALLLLGIRVTVRGREHVPDGPCIVAANHASYIDAFVLGLALPPRFGFVAKKELGRNPLLDIVLRRMGTRYVERNDTHQSIDDAERLLSDTSQGRSLIFFPEGTFTRAPGLRPFRMGAFLAAANAGMPVLPVALRGTRNILRGSDWFPHHGHVEIRILPPLRADRPGWQGAVALKQQVREHILQHCGEPDVS